MPNSSARCSRSRSYNSTSRSTNLHAHRSLFVPGRFSFTFRRRSSPRSSATHFRRNEQRSFTRAQALPLCPPSEIARRNRLHASQRISSNPVIGNRQRRTLPPAASRPSRRSALRVRPAILHERSRSRKSSCARRTKSPAGSAGSRARCVSHSRFRMRSICAIASFRDSMRAHRCACV